MRGERYTPDLDSATLAGGNTTAGPFGATVEVSTLSAGRIEVTASIDHPAIQMVTTRQEVWLTKN